MSYKETINKERLPQHIAIIMDGNGRWAKERQLERYRGHLEGVESVRAVTEAATELGIGYLTLYTFSTENWNRPQEEVNALMSLFVAEIEKETPTFIKNNVRLKVIGDLSRLPKDVFDKMERCMEQTSQHTGLTLQLALSYSARWEITHAAQEIAKKVAQDQLSAEAITEELFAQHLTTVGEPDPDILIRTGKEQRISNYLLWQISYAELFFPALYWPDFKKEEFYQIISEYQTRERRFGKISEQL